MLENDLYYIENKEIEEDSAIFYIALKANCEIFKGHFPGLPQICSRSSLSLNPSGSI